MTVSCGPLFSVKAQRIKSNFHFNCMSLSYKMNIIVWCLKWLKTSNLDFMIVKKVSNLNNIKSYDKLNGMKGIDKIVWLRCCWYWSVDITHSFSICGKLVSHKLLNLTLLLICVSKIVLKLHREDFQQHADNFREKLSLQNARN